MQFIYKILSNEMNCENFSTLVINMLVLIELIFIYSLEE
jgi:hypothetical protein